MQHSVFRYDSAGSLRVGAMSVEEALRASGAGTPAYLYDLDAVTGRYAEFREAVGAGPVVAAALKANPLPALLAPLRDLGAGAEAVSGAEALLARGLGFPGERITMSGVGKTAADLDAALEAGARFVSVESPGELELLAERAARRGRSAGVALRLNPDIAVDTHPKIATGRASSKFGMAEPLLLETAERARELDGIEVLGVHAHIGSQVRSAAAFRENAARLGRLLDRLRAAGHPADLVDVGGGLGLSEADGRPAPSFSEYADAVREGLSAVRPAPEVWFEPGRCLFGAAGALVVGVLHTKTSGGAEFCVVDSGMNDFLRPALYGARHPVLPTVRRDAPERGFEVVGGVCESGDSFGSDLPLPPPRPGDRLAVLDAGAYGSSMASNYNLRPRPAEVVVSGREAFLVRRRESPAELAAREREAELLPEAAAGA